MAASLVVLLCGVAAVAATPFFDPVISKLDPTGLRYEYLRDGSGVPHLVDSWIKASDISAAARYNPDTDNVYHLYTRANPTVSDPLLLGAPMLVANSNFDPSKRTVVTIHGFLGSATAAFNTVLVPALLEAGDVNVIVADWGRGAYWGLNGVQAASGIANFISWLNQISGARVEDYTVVGYSVGGHSAGMVGRALSGRVAYVVACDPSERWREGEYIKASDSFYTEVIHTHAGSSGTIEPGGHVDFYPNGGSRQPGCLTPFCHHDRSYYFFAESLTSGGFTGTECATLDDALDGTCDGAGRLQLGGLSPKTGSSGMYYLDTNSAPPFSRG